MQNPDQLPGVLPIIGAAYDMAVMRQKVVVDQWRTLSWRLGSLLPHSLLLVSIQRCGRLDALVRCLEDEYATYVTNPNQAPLSAGDMLHTLSESWIGSIYAILFVLARRLKLEIDGLEGLHEDSRLIRVALEKHEIPSDRDLKEPIKLQTFSTAPAADEKTFRYDKNDPLRSHIMPSGINPQGSICWLVTDLKNNNTRWLARRYISDRALALAEQSKSTPG
jgi:hypothetical protein